MIQDQSRASVLADVIGRNGFILTRKAVVVDHSGRENSLGTLSDTCRGETLLTRVFGVRVLSGFAVADVSRAELVAIDGFYVDVFAAVSNGLPTTGSYRAE